LIACATGVGQAVDGAGVGDGLMVGSVVGLIEGSLVGIDDGNSEGLVVEITDGCIVGGLVRTVDGLLVGGANEGFLVGLLAVGAIVAVGSPDGVTVGSLGVALVIIKVCVAASVAPLKVEIAFSEAGCDPIEAARSWSACFSMRSFSLLVLSVENGPLLIDEIMVINIIIVKNTNSSFANISSK